MGDSGGDGMLAGELDIRDILFWKRCDVRLVTLYRTAPNCRRSLAKRVSRRLKCASRPKVPPGASPRRLSCMSRPEFYYPACD